MEGERERPFFSLAKAKCVTPILYQAGDTQVRVYAVPEDGMATIWDADVLIWASQILTAQDRGLPTSRFFRFTPYQLLIAVGRATGNREHQLLNGALTRLRSNRHPHDHQSRRALASPAVLLGQRMGEAHHAFWQQRGHGVRAAGMVLRGVLGRRLVLAIDPAYFALSSGIKSWLYRVAQARRPPTRRVALRTRASPCQERELGAVLRLRARYPTHRRASAVAGLCVCA
jgi:plasmid replication initiation protein